MKASKKITGKVLGCDKETILEMCQEKKGEDVALYNIIGYAFRATVEESDSPDMDDYIKLQGRFEGQSFITGEIVNSGVLILPAIASTIISGQLLTQDENNQKIAEVALTVTAHYEKDAACMYVYGVEIHNADEKAFDKLAALIPDKFALVGKKEDQKKLPKNGKATKAKP